MDSAFHDPGCSGDGSDPLEGGGTALGKEDASCGCFLDDGGLLYTNRTSSLSDPAENLYGDCNASRAKSSVLFVVTSSVASTEDMAVSKYYISSASSLEIPAEVISEKWVLERR